MSFKDCVEAAVKAGSLTREQAEDLYTRQQDAQARFVLDPQHSAESAARMADELGIERAKQQVRLQKYQAALQAIRNTENAGNILRHPSGATLGLRAVIARDAKHRADWLNVDHAARAIRGQSETSLGEGLSALRTRMAGLQQDKPLLRKVVRELKGEGTGDARAAAFAKAWAKVAEDLRLRFNRSGGAIPRREDWGLPQSHDAVLVGKVEREEWVEFVMERLDIERMTDVETGSAFTPDALRLSLSNVYETIRTNGLSDMAPGAAGGKKLANRRQEARFLVFRDADSWLEYQDRFGSQNLLATMMDHVTQMSREIAMLEVLGPNPNAAYKYLTDVARKAEPDKALARQQNDGIWAIVNGTGDENRSPRLAHVTGAIRNWNVSALLGSASLSAVSDLGFLTVTGRWNGLSATKLLGRYMTMIDPSNEAGRIFATRTGITALSWSDAYSNIGRLSEIGGTGGGALGRVSHAGAKMAELTIRASGLNAMTDAGRRAFAMEFAATLAESVGHTLDEVPGNFGKTLREHGMTAAEWDVLRSTPLAEHEGARFFVVDNLMAREDIPLSQRQAVAGRFQQALSIEMLHAIPEPDALAKFWTTAGGKQSGTIAGEAGRTGLQFKSFPIAVLSTHLNRALYARQLRGGMSGAAYAAHAIVATTLMGLVAAQLKLMKSGKDPRPMDDPKTWAAAFVQGGGAGIYADFLFSDVNRFGGGATSTLSGPTMGLINDTAVLTLGNVQQVIAGEDPEALADLVGFATRYTPGGSLWYARLLLEREIFDQLALMADPSGAQNRFNRAERRARDQGTEHWWRPGETSPDRAPSVGGQ